MKRVLLLSFLLPACGSAFTEAITPPDADTDVAAQETGNSRHEGGRPHHDGGFDAASDVAESGMLDDSVVPPMDAAGDTTGDTGTVDVSVPDTSPADTGPCNPPSSYQYKIFSGGSTFIGYTSPVECQCASTYTCACLLAASGICTATFGTPTGCTPGSTITVDCTP